MMAAVFMLFLIISDQMSNIRLISEISEFSLGQIRKLAKIFLSFRTDLNFISKCALQWWQLFSCFS